MEETRTYLQTTDGRFHRVWQDIWWDTSGADLYDDAHVVRHINENPGVGFVVLLQSR